MTIFVNLKKNVKVFGNFLTFKCTFPEGHLSIHRICDALDARIMKIPVQSHALA